ncbi:MAG TPA: cupin domain-containing protein [Sedimentisphaerales bacterium]|nr:cupin domain-containing protein [Sedimentisphaerales bacterium]
MSSSKKVLVIDLDKTCNNQKLLDGEPGTRGMRSGRVYLGPGLACGQHSTKDREELLVFLSGRGELLIGEKDRFQVGQGRVCYIPPQTPHDVKNTGAEPLVYVYCVTPVSGEFSQ